MFKLKQYNYIFTLGFILLQQSICFACNVTFFVNTDPPSCPGDSDGKITITVNEGIPPFIYSFDEGATFSTENFIENLPSGVYNIVVVDADGCVESRVIIFTNPPSLQVDLGENLSIQLGKDVQIDAQISGVYDGIEWNSSDTNTTAIFQDEPYLNFYPFASQTIYIIVKDNNCYSVDSIHIEVERVDDVFIPNVFSPNGDGFNDRFNIYAGNSVAQVNKFQVLDNWGGVVYEAIDFSPHYVDNGWDGLFNGKSMIPNIYVYCAEVEYIDGETKFFCGDVLLLR